MFIKYYYVVNNIWKDLRYKAEKGMAYSSVSNACVWGLCVQVLSDALWSSILSMEHITAVYQGLGGLGKHNA